MQVIKTFHIHDLFCEAINECPDITQGTFPFLSKNKSSGGGNVSELTTNAHHCYMIYIACLYQARLIMKKLKPDYDIPSFSFQSYPTVKGIFTIISNSEKHFHWYQNSFEEAQFRF